MKRISLAIAVIILVNLVILFTPFTRYTWDSETHMFFASHYSQAWFNPWEERWMTGFWVWGYPPLAHQLIALSSFFVDMDLAYRMIQALGLVALPVAMWWFSTPLIGKENAPWAALLAALVPGLYVMLYTFGQMTTFIGMVLALSALGCFARYLITGKSKYLIGWFLFAGTAQTAHHFTVITVMPMVVTVVGTSIWLKGELSFKTFVKRLSISGVVMIVAAVIAIYPFWWWYFNLNLPQTGIDHTTRMNFFLNPKEREIFFYGIYGALFILFPLSLWSIRFKFHLWPFVILVIFLSLLGLGSFLTPLPRLLFRFHDVWEWLTYERYGIWAAMLSVLPVSICVRSLSHLRFGRTMQMLVLGALLAGIARESSFTMWEPVLPPPLRQWEEETIWQFLLKDDHDDWRYVTFGLGEAEFARISRLTSAQTIDGTYYTGRIPQEFRESGIGMIDASFWWGEKSYPLLFSILQHPEKLNLKFAFSNDRWVDMHLENSGWTRIHTLGSDVDYEPADSMLSTVWLWQAPLNREDILPIEPYSPQYPAILAVLWGTTPLLFLIGSVLWVVLHSRRRS